MRVSIANGLRITVHPMCRRPIGQGLFPTILLHFHRPWRSDVGRYDSRARIVLTCMDALMPRTHGCGGAANNPFAFPPLHPRPTGTYEGTTPGQGLFPKIALHFHHPWWSEGGGRVAPRAATESNAGARQGRWKLEQRRSSCRSSCRNSDREA